MSPGHWIAAPENVPYHLIVQAVGPVRIRGGDGVAEAEPVSRIGGKWLLQGTLGKFFYVLYILLMERAADTVIQISLQVAASWKIVLSAAHRTSASAAFRSASGMLLPI